MNPRTRMTIAQAALAACVLCSGGVAADDMSLPDAGFNAVGGDANQLMIAVGNHGVIVHLAGGGEARRVVSPTDADLLDVHVGSPDFAVTVGQGAVLLWNGESWRPLTDAASNALYHHAWASPDELLVLYAGGADTNTVCPWIPDAIHQPFCRLFKAPMLGACGDHETIHLVLANGEIYRLNDALLGKDGQFGPVYRPDEHLELESASFAGETCLPDQLPQIYAADTDGGLVRFDGRSWRAVDPASARVAHVQAPGFGMRSDRELAGSQ